MNHDLDLISQWAHTWRMSFNPDLQKQAVELPFSRKKIETDHPMILFNDTPVEKVSEHKHLGIILDSKLSFSAHIKSAFSKTRKGIGLLKYLSIHLTRHTLNELYNDLSSANSLTMRFKPTARSFIYTRKNKGPRIEPWAPLPKYLPS